MNVPFLEYEAIWKIADDFRDGPQLHGYNIPPIDVLYIIDVVLGFDVIPTPSLFADIRMDAAILPGQKEIYVDRDSMEEWEGKDNWIEKRLRFSVAHELGHYFMHQDLLAEFNPADLNQFKKWILKYGSNSRIELQADEFAGRFLVPPDNLFKEYDQIQRRMEEADSRWHEIEGMRARMANRIAPKFGVTRKVIETRFDHEAIWPLE
jgi:hypothetical protein